MIPYDDDDGQLLGTSGSSGAFSSPFFFFYMSNLNRLHYHPFLLKIVTNQSLCFFLYFLAATTLKFLYLGGGSNRAAQITIYNGSFQTK